MKTKLLLLSAVVASAVSSGTLAQTYSGSTDRTIPRYCVDRCVQSGEQVAVDANGNGYAIWFESGYNYWNDSYTPTLMAARFDAATQTWGSPHTIASSYSQSAAGTYKVVVNGAGQAMIIWVDGMPNSWSGGGVVFRAATWRSNYWDVREVYRDYDTLIVNPVSIGANKRGEIFVSYSTRNNYYTNSTQVYNFKLDAAYRNWAMISATPTSFNAMAIDEFGSGVGALITTNPLKRLITRRYSASNNAWLEEAVHEYGSYNSIKNLVMASEPGTGNAMMVYEAINTSTGARVIRTRHFNKASRTWTTKTLPGSMSQLYGTPSLVGDKNKNFYIAYNQYNGAYIKTMSSRYTASSGTWSTPRVVSQGNYHTREAVVTVDSSARAIYTWGQRTDTGTGSSTGKVFRMTTSRFADNAWSWPVAFQDASRIGYKPFAATDNSGRTLVIWNQDSSVSGVKELKSDRLQAR